MSSAYITFAEAVRRYDVSRYLLYKWAFGAAPALPTYPNPGDPHGIGVLKVAELEALLETYRPRARYSHLVPPGWILFADIQRTYQVSIDRLHTLERKGILHPQPLPDTKRTGKIVLRSEVEAAVRDGYLPTLNAAAVR